MALYYVVSVVLVFKIQFLGSTSIMDPLFDVPSVSVIYNVVTIIGRTVFWQMQNDYLAMWTMLDYLVDLVYIGDMFISSRTGIILLSSTRIPFLCSNCLPSPLRRGSTCPHHLTLPWFVVYNGRLPLTTT